jgi:hypothetical protein
LAELIYRKPFPSLNEVHNFVHVLFSFALIRYTVSHTCNIYYIVRFLIVSEIEKQFSDDNIAGIC